MTIPYNLQQLETNHPAVILRCIAGSRAYGTHHAKSDTDIRGVFMLPKNQYLSLKAASPQVSDAKGDTVYYSLRRLLDLASQANPNILELLYTPEDCQVYLHPLSQILFENRHLFITQKVQDTYVGYAKAQIKKATGQNKWVHRPQPKALPQPEAFCWFLTSSDHDEDSQQPRPILEMVDQVSQCFLTKVEHFPHMYRLYRARSQTFGLFKNGKLWCQPHINQIKEREFLGLIHFNATAFEAAKRDHKNYWHWVKHRNHSRWETQTAGLIDYDPKNLMHTFRLLLSGIHILEYGEPLVRFQGEQLAFLMKILAGQFSFPELCERADAMIADIQSAKRVSPLRAEVEAEKVDRILCQMTEQWEADHG